MDTQTGPLIDELRAIRARATALVARIPDDEAFQWQPDEGRAWSVGHCLQHLNQMNRLYFGQIQRALADAPRESAPVSHPIASSWFGRWFTRQMGPDGMKARAPEAAVPAAPGSRDDVAAEFFRGLDEIEATLRGAVAIDLNRVTYASPFFRLSRVRAGTGFRILLAHMRRHLQQAERTAEARR